MRVEPVPVMLPVAVSEAFGEPDQISTVPFLPDLSNASSASLAASCSASFLLGPHALGNRLPEITTEISKHLL